MRNSNKHGFTLLETVLVIAIIVIISAASFIAVKNYLDTAKHTAERLEERKKAVAEIAGIIDDETGGSGGAIISAGNEGYASAGSGSSSGSSGAGDSSGSSGGAGAAASDLTDDEDESDNSDGSESGDSDENQADGSDEGDSDDSDESNGESSYDPYADDSNVYTGYSGQSDEIAGYEMDADTEAAVTDIAEALYSSEILGSYYDNRNRAGTGINSTEISRDPFARKINEEISEVLGYEPSDITWRTYLNEDGSTDIYVAGTDIEATRYGIGDRVSVMFYDGSEGVYRYGTVQIAASRESGLTFRYLYTTSFVETV